MESLSLESRLGTHSVSQLVDIIKRKVAGMRTAAEMNSRRQTHGRRSQSAMAAADVLPSALIHMNEDAFHVLCAYAVQLAGDESLKKKLDIELATDVVGKIDEIKATSDRNFFTTLVGHIIGDLRAGRGAVTSKFRAVSNASLRTSTNLGGSTEVSAGQKPTMARGLKADLLGGDFATESQLGSSQLDKIYT